MAIDKELTKKINRTAHHLAQLQFHTIRNTLMARCKALAAEGKTRSEILAALVSKPVSPL